MPYVLQKHLAAHLDCSLSTIANYLAKGIIKRRKDGKYDLDANRIAVLRWLRLGRQGGARAAGDLDLSAERAKLAKQQSEAINFKMNVARGEYIKIDLAIKAFEANIAVVRETVLTIPGTLADQLASTEHPRDEVESILRDVCYATLEALADPKTYASLAAALLADGAEAEDGEGEQG